MSDIPAEAKQAIDSVIENDEGGWVITKDPNDADGGWTYAGVTANTWNEYAKTKEKDKSNITKDDIYQIYYAKYYKPLAQHFDNLTDYELSCAINCGNQTAVDCYSPGAGLLYRQTFLHKWLLHYAELVKKNAEAWRDYALASEACLNEVLKTGTVSVPKIDKPTTLRAEFLAGWINRVERYRQ